MSASNIVTVEGFPHGVRCHDCHEIIEPGMAYSERLTGVIAETDIACVELVCPPCALRAASAPE